MTVFGILAKNDTHVTRADLSVRLASNLPTPPPAITTRAHRRSTWQVTDASTRRRPAGTPLPVRGA